MAITVLGHLYHHQGEIAHAWEMVREILPRGRDSERDDGLFPYAIGILRLATRLAYETGELSDAREWLETHDAWLDWSGAIRGRAESAALWSNVLHLEGKITQAVNRARLSVELAEQPRQPLALIEAERTLGRIAARHGLPYDPVTHLRSALELARSCDAPFEQALCEVALAELHLEHHDEREAALALLNNARARAEPLQAAPLLRHIDSLLAIPVEQDGLSVLTEREIEVLRIVSRGMTDAEAAEMLFISPRTVSQHLRSVYNKLGVSSRTAATRWAVQNNLV